MPQLPTDELTEYLQRRSVPPDEAREVQALYAQAVAHANAATWDRDRTYEWLDQQIEAISSQTPAGGTESDSNANTRAATNAIAERAAAVADDQARAANERAQRVRNSYKVTDEYVYDAGPSVDPGQISSSLAVGYWVDDNGNPIDPSTGKPTDEPVSADSTTLWEMIKGQKFDMGSLAMPGYRERRTRGYRPRAAFTGTEPGTPSSRQAGMDFLARIGITGPGYTPARPTQTRVMTPSQAMALLNNMDEDYLLKIQQQMWDAGLYSAAGEGVRPDWGKPDPGTQKAFQQLFIEASLDPDAPIQQVLANLAERNVANLADVPGAPGSAMPDFKPEVASTETLSKLIDELSQNLLGQYVDDETKNKLISDLQGKEVDTQRQQYLQDASSYGSDMPGMEDIDVFMAAISGQESGGDYGAVNERTGAYGRFQIMPSNWRPWATRAGLGPNAPRTPENQEIVAKRIMMDYYAQFGNWRDVAIAWFAGPDNVGLPEGGSDGNMTIREYADGILDRMAQMRGQGGLGAGLGTAGGTEFAPVERFDPAAEAEAALKAANPDAWVGHQWGDRATEFYGLLGGVV